MHDQSVLDKIHPSVDGGLQAYWPVVAQTEFTYYRHWNKTLEVISSFIKMLVFFWAQKYASGTVTLDINAVSSLSLNIMMPKFRDDLCKSFHEIPKIYTTSSKQSNKTNFAANSPMHIRKFPEWSEKFGSWNVFMAYDFFCFYTSNSFCYRALVL